MSPTSLKEVLKSSEEGSSKFLYIFSSLKGCADYILYRIDALKHLYESSSNTTQQEIFELHPLLVFTDHVLPRECLCVKLLSNFYFFNRYLYSPSFFGEYGQEDNTDVYMIRESDLIDLEPSEYNTDSRKYLIKCASMNEVKDNPTVIVAKNKLYVLSQVSETSTFEVYSPDLDTWRNLPTQPEPGKPGSYVIVNDVLYFEVWSSVLSFDLNREVWGIMPLIGPALPRREIFEYPPGISNRLAIMGNMAFGFLYKCDHYVPDSSLHCLTICAAPLPHKKEFAKNEFLRPSISLDDEFLQALNSSRCPYATWKSIENFSDYIVPLDGAKVLCLISWGTGVGNEDRAPDPCTSYATLSFFKVTPQEGPSPNTENSNEKADGNCVPRKCVKGRFMHIRGRARYVVVPRRCVKAKHHANVKADEKSALRRCIKANLKSRGRARIIDYAKAEADDGKCVFRRCSRAELLLTGNRAHDVEYANMKADGKYLSRRCLETKILHSAQFIIKTTRLFNIGQTRSCFFEGL